MANPAMVTNELAGLLGVLAHPHRIRIMEELLHGERDLHALQAAVMISQMGMAQHLAILRTHRLVRIRTEGRRTYFQAQRPGLTNWLLDGAKFLNPHHDILADNSPYERFQALCLEQRRPKQLQEQAG